MAEAAVSLVIDKLVPLISQEVKLVKGVHEEVADIKANLEGIQAFLKDVDSKMKKEGISEQAKLWVKQVREIAYLIGDVIDQYKFHAARYGDRRGFVGFLHRISSLVTELQGRNEIASKIQDIRRSLQKVKDRSEGFKFISLGQEASSSNARNVLPHDPRLHSLSIEEAELVGIEDSRNELISCLISGTSQRKVISVVGLGGVGKTTIARKVYDNHSVKRHFECRAWISVSQTYDKKQLLWRILWTLSEEKDEVHLHNIAALDEYPLLISKLREYLQEQLYLVVFDDVWQTGFWGDVEHALLDNDNGSRILFTTRNEGAANFCRSSSLVDVYRIEPLPHQEAWELFCRRAFKFEFGGKCPNDLEELSHDIVRRCGGLPLAIGAVGGLLATKDKVTSEWKKLLDTLSVALVDDPHLETVTKILSLSYSDLPYNLKSCVLYLGMFPEDFCIRCKRLIQLWVAESLVQEKQGMTLEDLAEEYLTELIHRSLIQVDTVSLKGIASTCRIHDLVREIILSKQEELSFCHISRDCSKYGGIARHLSINRTGSDNPTSSTKSQTRSIMVFDKIKLQKSRICTIFSSCKLLTTLDFEDCPIDHMPKDLGELLYLRYLNLKETKVSKLPISIRKLHNLEFLDLRGSLVEELPVEIGNFPKLRHLLGGYAPSDGVKIYGNIEQLEFLQTLFGIRIDANDDSRLIHELGMLKQLRKLGITNLKREHGRDLCISLEKMSNLLSIFINAINSADGILEVQSMSSLPPHLKTLYLFGRLERLPEWISKLYNLSQLFLLTSMLMDDPISVLQSLPNLKGLMLSFAYNGKKMHFEGGGFQKLNFLCLIYLNALHSIIIDNEALPVLQELYIGHCPLMKEVPSGIQHLKGLKQLSFGGMSDDFKQRLSLDGGEDYWIIKHVPTLRYDGTYNPNDKTSYRIYAGASGSFWLNADRNMS